MRDTLNKLRAKAKAEGLFVPHLPTEHGGLGLGIMGMCALFREMGRSPVGATCFNCDAPDQGNMDLLLRSPYSAMAKDHVPKLLCQVMDDVIQMHGSLGYSEDMPLATWYRFARAARIADGPDEVRSVVVARDFLRGALTTLV